MGMRLNLSLAVIEQDPEKTIEALLKTGKAEELTTVVHAGMVYEEALKIATENLPTSHPSRLQVGTATFSIFGKFK